MEIRKVETNQKHHLVKNFFTDHYDHPIYESGVQLVDMMYLQRAL